MIALLLAASVAINTSHIKIPERYRGDAVVMTWYTTPETIAKVCGGNAVRACLIERDGMKMMLVRNPCYRADIEQQAEDECHEKGHFLGWSKEHEK